MTRIERLRYQIELHLFWLERFGRNPWFRPPLPDYSRPATATNSSRSLTGQITPSQNTLEGTEYASDQALKAHQLGYESAQKVAEITGESHVDAYKYLADARLGAAEANAAARERSPERLAADMAAKAAAGGVPIDTAYQQALAAITGQPLIQVPADPGSKGLRPARPAQTFTSKEQFANAMLQSAPPDVLADKSKAAAYLEDQFNKYGVTMQ